MDTALNSGTNVSEENGSGAHPAAVAVIGMSGRFPGAAGLDAFWRNLREGVESIRTFTEEELRAAGTDEALLRDPAFVPRIGALDDVERFDAAFFGYSPREAETLEPSHRLFLECCWEAMEAGGYDPARVPGPVGVFAGSGTPYYTERNVRANAELAERVGEFQIVVGSGKDFLATRVAYKLDLRGPALAVQTGCSTSLVAVHLAAQSLLSRECDLALAGGAHVVVPTVLGYRHEPGSIASPDGRCRAFDADAAGTLAGSGAGAVLLKRLEDALRDGDPVRAVILGSAVNNDGAAKVAFTAPGIEGQAAVVAEALEVAGVDPETIRYVEGHGSGTELGDPIEIAALTRAYRSWTDRRGFAAVGSVKTNLGHLDAAAGIAGFVKTVLALENREIPPTLHFRAPNPKIDFASSPFYVAARLEGWERDGAPRRAGVSSFGIGGTNAHVVLEEAPTPAPSLPRRDRHLLVLSARTPAALEAATDRLAARLAEGGVPLADAAWTLQAGRHEFACRRAVVVRDGEDAAALLRERHPERVRTAAVPEGAREVVFLFPGVGEQYPGMARGLYETEPVFRAEVDRCAEILRPLLGTDLRELLFPPRAAEEQTAAAAGGIDLRAMLRGAPADPVKERLDRTEMAQPAVFVVEYALARLWMSWGIVPAAVIGHSLGEYAAACVAGVFTLEDALRLVAERARLIGALPGGAMLAVPLSPEAVAPYLAEGAVVATVNAPALCVAAGAAEAVEGVRRRLEAAGIAARPLAATHAFHSPMMDPVVAPVEALLRSMALSAPRIPLVSNLTGGWMEAEEATDPRRWARHTREPVRFDRGAALLLETPGRVLLEVGPGQTLSTFVRQQGAAAAEVPVIPSVRYPYDRTADEDFLLGALGRLWLAGVTPDWTAFHEGERLRRVPLPTYPWERERYWVEAPAPGARPAARGGRSGGPAAWLSVPSWRRTAAARAGTGGERVLVIGAGDPLGTAAVDALRAGGRTVVEAAAGEGFSRAGGRFVVRPGSVEELRRLLSTLAEEDAFPDVVLHLASLEEADPSRAAVALLALGDALGRHPDRAVRLVAAVRGAVRVEGGDAGDPARAALPGALAGMAAELPSLSVRTVDVGEGAEGAALAAEALAGEGALVALRGRTRWARAFEPVSPAPVAAPVLREGGVYLLVGGLRGRNEAIAAHLAARGARLALLDPTLPQPSSWDVVAKARLPEDPVRRQIERIREMMAEGTEILTLQLRTGEAAQVREAVERVEARFGALHGVVYSPLAHEPAERQSIGEVRLHPWERRMMHLTDELEGVARGLEGRALDFVVVESSLAPVLGGVGFAGMAAVHAVADAFCAVAGEREGQPWTAAGWDRWWAPGEAREGYGMDEAEAVAALEHLLTLAGEPQVYLSTGPLEARLAEQAAAAAAPAVGAYARPHLATDYEAPSTDAESVIAGMWEELLGIAPIGIHDDFFALGGHSLLATQIVSRCRDELGLELPLKAIFEAPTPARFAALVEEALVAEIAQLSDEEALALAGSA
jgi:phthiocerol/phenolphthiocerol synthesis type-I polyketide synthase E